MGADDDVDKECAAMLLCKRDPKSRESDALAGFTQGALPVSGITGATGIGRDMPDASSMNTLVPFLAVLQPEKNRAFAFVCCFRPVSAHRTAWAKHCDTFVWVSAEVST